MNGTVLALPSSALIGRTGRVHDVSGVAYIAGMKRLAVEGGGSINYIYQTLRECAEDLKLGYVLPDETSSSAQGLHPGVAAVQHERSGRSSSVRPQDMRRSREEAACCVQRYLRGFC